MNDLYVLIFGTLATLGFSLVFNSKPKRLIFMTLSGFLSTVVYLLTDELSVFVCNIISAFAITMYAEVIARIIKAPVITFLTAGIIPLVPGSSLYYTISSILKKDYALASDYALTTLGVCIGIATGIVLASLLTSCFLYLQAKAKKSKKE